MNIMKNLTSHQSTKMAATDGVPLWGRQVHSANSGTIYIGTGIEYLTNGEVVTVADVDVNGSMEFSSGFGGTQTGPSEFLPLNTRGLLIKYLSNGAYSFYRRLEFIRFIGVAKDSNNNIAAIGRSTVGFGSQTVTFGNGDSGTINTFTGSISQNTQILIRYLNNGSAQWVRFIDQGNIQDVQCDSANNIYVLLHLTGDSFNISGINGTNPNPGGVSGPAASRCVVLLGFNSNGNHFFTRWFADVINGNRLFISAAGDIYISGRKRGGDLVNTNLNANAFGGTTSFSFPVSKSSGPSVDQAFILRYNSAGVPQWIRWIQGANSITAEKLVVDNLNDTICLFNVNNGVTTINLATDANGGIFPTETITRPSSFDQAILLMKYNVNGQYVWSRWIFVNSTGRVSSQGITVDHVRNIYFTCVAGSSGVTGSNNITLNSNANGGNTAITISNVTAVNNATLIFKYGQFGLPLWYRMVRSSNSYIFPTTGNQISAGEFTAKNGQIYLLATSNSGSGNFNDNAAGGITSFSQTYSLFGPSLTYYFALKYQTLTNSHPTDVLLSSSTLAENAGVNFVIGTFSSVDADPGETFTYSLVSGTGDTNNSLFNINGTQLRANNSFNFEVQNSFSIRVRTTDSNGDFFEKIFNITVTNVNETPTDIILSNATLPENAGTNFVIGQFTTVDPDDPLTPQSFTYTLVTGTGSTNNNLFNISTNNLRATNSFNFETQNSFSIRVRSTDQGGLWVEKAFTITVTNVNEAPTDIILSNATLPENAGTNFVIGQFTTVDPDDPLTPQSFTYTLVTGTGSTNNNLFNISTNNLRATNSLDFETQGSLSIRVRSTDQGGLWVEKAFTITVTNVNEAPTDIILSNSSLPENAGSNFVVGQFSTVDPDFPPTPQTFTYSLVTGTGSTHNSLFNISSNNLRATNSLDHETQGSLSIRVRTTDQGGQIFEKVFTITVTNVNETPTDITLSTLSIAENASVESVVGTFTTTDQDVGDTHTYSLVSGTGSTHNLDFHIVGSQLRTTTQFDFELQPTRSIRVRTTDAGNLTFEKVFTITITNVNEPPRNFFLSNSRIREGRDTNTIIGTFTTEDLDPANTYTYTLVTGTGSTDNASFNINGANLRSSIVFNFATKSTYSIRVRSTDQGSLFIERIFIINIQREAALATPAYTSLTFQNTIDNNSGIISRTDSQLRNDVLFTTTFNCSESPRFFMYGPWIGSMIPVQLIVTSGGNTYYAIQDGSLVKIVDNTGESRFFTGTLNQFDPNLWNTYTNSFGRYILTQSQTSCEPWSGDIASDGIYPFLHRNDYKRTQYFARNQAPDFVTNLFANYKNYNFRQIIGDISTNITIATTDIAQQARTDISLNYFSPYIVDNSRNPLEITLEPITATALFGSGFTLALDISFITIGNAINPTTYTSTRRLQNIVNFTTLADRPNLNSFGIWLNQTDGAGENYLIANNLINGISREILHPDIISNNLSASLTFGAHHTIMMNYRPISSVSAEIDIFFDASAFYIARPVDISSSMWNRITIGGSYPNPLNAINDPHRHGRFAIRNFGFRLGEYATLTDASQFFDAAVLRRDICGTLDNFYGLTARQPTILGSTGDTSANGLFVTSLADLQRITSAPGPANKPTVFQQTATIDCSRVIFRDQMIGISADSLHNFMQPLIWFGNNNQLRNLRLQHTSVFGNLVGPSEIHELGIFGIDISMTNNSNILRNANTPPLGIFVNSISGSLIIRDSFMTNYDARPESFAVIDMSYQTAPIQESVTGVRSLSSTHPGYISPAPTIGDIESTSDAILETFAGYTINTNYNPIQSGLNETGTIICDDGVIRPYFIPQNDPGSGRSVEILDILGGFTSPAFTFDPESEIGIIVNMPIYVSGGMLDGVVYDSTKPNLSIIFEASGIGGNVGNSFAGALNFNFTDKLSVENLITSGIFTNVSIQQNLESPLTVIYNRWIMITFVLTRDRLIAYYDRAFGFAININVTTIPFELYRYRFGIVKLDVNPRVFIGGFFTRSV